MDLTKEQQRNLMALVWIVANREPPKGELTFTSQDLRAAAGITAKRIRMFHDESTDKFVLRFETDDDKNEQEPAE